jgi:hypothetical protein
MTPDQLLVCWNCDRRTDVTFGIVVDMPSGRAASFHVCQACYTTIGLAELGLLPQRPPSPGA